MNTDLYPANESTVSQSSLTIGDPWLGFTTAGEVDLRQELYEMLYGTSSEIAKGQRGILRRMRLDTDGNKISCPCVDPITREPDRDTFCSYCHGEAYLWDEEWVTYYKVVVSSNEGLVRKDRYQKSGIGNIPYTFFYMEYHVNPTRYDKVVELERDTEGGLVVPYTRKNIYTIATAEDFRSDTGRIEYWRLASTEDAIISTYQGGS